MKLDLPRWLWRTGVPSSLRDAVNARRAFRREAAWRRPRKLGELRRTTPFSTWGSSRGGPIDRVYIGQFIEAHAADVQGRVLEIAGDEYITRFGRGVTQADVLDVFDDNPKATIVADLTRADVIEDDTFDCLVVTQVVLFVEDISAALRECHRILRPGGVLLATTPGISRLAPIESKTLGQWWHLTSMSARSLAEEYFGPGNVEIRTYGNVLAAAGFLYGLGEWDVTPDELAVHDPAFEVIIGIRAVKRA
ncbi:MAG TPA: methyltransferase domain-containing protein [Gaiellaceae bacterium]|nr:methyltransferase domain-containing protein [Gaiellaceae bacterium]